MARFRAQTAPVVFLALVLGTALALSLRPLPLGAEEGPEAPPQRTPSAWVLGLSRVGADAVVDGDTLRLLDGGPTVRVLALDTEEVFKDDADRVAAATDFVAYAREKRGGSKVPVKFATPAGEAAKAFVLHLFEGVTAVRLERDEVLGHEIDPYGRRLAHVFLLRAGSESNLAAEVIRAGHSPYFTKYGRSVRFHDEFTALEREAQEARRGMWAQDGPDHYPDYGERRAWWERRAAQVERWRALAGRPDHVTLGAADADTRLATLLGQPVVVFGLFDRELPTGSPDRRVLLLAHRPQRGLPLVFFAPEVAARLDPDALATRYVTVRGSLSTFRGRPQIVVEAASQVSTE